MRDRTLRRNTERLYEKTKELLVKKKAAFITGCTEIAVVTEPTGKLYEISSPIAHALVYYPLRWTIKFTAFIKRDGDEILESWVFKCSEPIVQKDVLNKIVEFVIPEIKALYDLNTVYAVGWVAGIGEPSDDHIYNIAASMGVWDFKEPMLAYEDGRRLFGVELNEADKDNL